jgi:hypothetical protein
LSQRARQTGVNVVGKLEAKERGRVHRPGRSRAVREGWSGVVYELWDTGAGRFVRAFDSEAAALDAVYRALVGAGRADSRLAIRRGTAATAAPRRDRPLSAAWLLSRLLPGLETGSRGGP